MVRFLGFPEVRYMNDSRLNAVKRMIYAFAILVMIPSVFMAINLVQESAFNTQTIKFVHDIQQTPFFDNVQLIDSQKDYSKKSQTLTLRVIGKPLTDMDIERMETIMQTEYGLDHTKLIVKQMEGMMNIKQQNQVIEDIIDKKDAVIAQQDSTIVALRTELHKLTGSSENTEQLVKEIYSQQADIEQVAILSMECYDTQTLEHKAVPAIYLRWKDGRRHPDAERRLVEWLKVRLGVEEIEVVRMDS
jgi:hypothetical protein